MSVKLKNGLTKAISYIISLTGMAVIVIFQYCAESNPMPTWAKITVPALIALLIFFLIYYKSIKQKIARKLTAIETAKELGKPGQTNTIVANLLETIGIIIPMILISAIFVIGGECLEKTGVILFELLGMYSIIIIGNIICDANKKQELKQKELEKAEEISKQIADKIGNKFE